MDNIEVTEISPFWIRPESDLNQTWIRPESDLNQIWISLGIQERSTTIKIKQWEVHSARGIEMGLFADV